MLKHKYRCERGAILVITLVIMVAMTLASIGLLRSVDTAMLLASNIGFKRDTAARATLASNKILTELAQTSFIDNSDSYCVTTPCSAQANTAHYSPVMLETNTGGIPILLTSTSTYDTNFSSVDSGAGTTTRYIIDRMCDTVGSPSDEHCTYDDKQSLLRKNLGDYRGEGTSLGGGSKAGTTELPLFRLTVRVDGPRNTVAYLQAFSTLK